MPFRCCCLVRPYRRHNNVHEIESYYGQQQRTPFFFSGARLRNNWIDFFIFIFVLDKSNVALFTVGSRRRRNFYKTEHVAKCQLFIYSQIELSIDENKIPNNRTAKWPQWIRDADLRIIRFAFSVATQKINRLAAEIRMRMYKKGKFFASVVYTKHLTIDSDRAEPHRRGQLQWTRNTKKQSNWWKNSWIDGARVFKYYCIIIFSQLLSSAPLTTWEKVWSEKYEVSCFTKYVQRKVHSLFASFFLFFTFFLLCLTSAAAAVAVCISLVFRSRLLFD